MCMVFNRTCPKVPVPVTHFTYQEPENDPKSNTYLWVATDNPPLTRYICYQLHCIYIYPFKLLMLNFQNCIFSIHNFEIYWGLNFKKIKIFHQFFKQLRLNFSQKISIHNFKANEADIFQNLTFYFIFIC